jgi:3-hydroxybutyrate dehydrogenase/3-oxoacyl-[acyl-carrier protein] reductase
MVGEMSDEAWLDTLDLNLNSAFFMTRRALKYLAPQRWGRIIHISSVEGKQATKAAVSNYITTKHALNGFSKAVAYEYATQGITSNAICPGAIETDVMMEQGPKSAAASGMSYEQFKQNYADDAMIKRLNTVDEVAAMALLLASEVGGGITGATLAVDGGSSDY